MYSYIGILFAILLPFRHRVNDKSLVDTNTWHHYNQPVRLGQAEVAEWQTRYVQGVVSFKGV